jgi:hypothetical protein
MRSSAASRRASVGTGSVVVVALAANRWRRSTSCERETLSWRGGACPSTSTSVKVSVSGNDGKALASSVAAAAREPREARSESSQTRYVTIGGSSAADSTSSAGAPSIRTTKSARDRRKAESIRGRTESSTKTVLSVTISRSEKTSSDSGWLTATPGPTRHRSPPRTATRSREGDSRASPRRATRIHRRPG